MMLQLTPSRSPTGTQSRLGSLRLILRLGATNPHELIKLRFITFRLQPEVNIYSLESTVRRIILRP